MRAVRMYKPGDLRVEDVPKPVPGDGEVLLKVIACGICGSDIPRVNKYGAHIAPLTIGHEFSAEIVELGNNVDGFKVGDFVTVPPLMPCYKTWNIRNSTHGWRIRLKKLTRPCSPCFPCSKDSAFWQKPEQSGFLLQFLIKRLQ